MARKASALEERSYDLALKIVALVKQVRATHREYDLSRQLLRSGTSIGANVAEAVYAQSKADYIAKFSIALKQANETQYWLRLLHDCDYVVDTQVNDTRAQLDEVLALLVSTLKTLRTQAKPS